jgi:hypothetical protein
MSLWGALQSASSIKNVALFPAISFIYEDGSKYWLRCADNLTMAGCLFLRGFLFNFSVRYRALICGILYVGNVIRYGYGHRLDYRSIPGLLHRT